jgi:multiple stress resistance protein BhsA
LNIQTEEVTPDKNPASNILLNEVLDMKTLLIATLVMGFTSVNAASAAQEINHTDGKEKMGIVSASNAYTLDELSNTLSRKADGEGATSFKILSTTGNNRLHGVAEIYK